METVAAVGAATILVVVAAMQLALALGAPWGAHAYGGRVAGPGDRLPGPYRVASLVAVGLLLGAAWIVLARAGVVGDGLEDATFVRWGTWVVAAFLALNTLGNLASTSAIERWVLGTATALGSVLAFVVALS